jgi:predicted phage-related endonuclease
MPRPADDRLLLNLPEPEFQAAIAQKGIGGTDIGAILGLNPNMTAQRVWEHKMGMHPPQRDLPILRRGRVMEEAVAQEYSRATSRVVYQPNEEHPASQEVVQVAPLPGGGPYVPATLQILGVPWWIGTPDRYVARDAYGPLGILEIKVLSLESFQRTLREGVAPHYWAQLQWYLGAGQRSWGAFAILHPDTWTLRQFDVERDDEFLEMAAQHARTFWEVHVLTRQPVDLAAWRPHMGSEAIGHARARSRATRTHTPVGEGSELGVALQGLATAQASLRQAQEEVDGWKDVVTTLLGRTDLERVQVGNIRCSWTEQTRTQVQWGAFRQAFPDLPYDQFTQQSSSRVLRVTQVRSARDPIELDTPISEEVPL